MTIAIMILGAIILLGIAFGIAENARNIEHLEYIQAKQIESLSLTKAEMNTRLDNYISTHNATVEHYDKEIDDIIKKMEHITEEIRRIDHDERDLRSYYVNYRTPEVPNGGVPWAKDYPDQEEEHEIHNNEG